MSDTKIPTTGGKPYCETVDALLDYGEMGCAFGCQWAGECSREDTSR